MNERTTAIRVRNLSKLYRVYNNHRDILREFLTGRKLHTIKWALQDVSFDVGRGEVVGVVGSNGAGKSTLLKILAGTLEKSGGSIDIAGKISAILELGTGFSPQFTGRQNIVMGGMCLGMSREQVEMKLPWIIDFSELEDVIDQPFQTYSSGMQARLTFSTAIAIDPDILIIDEALAAGDAYFVSKCMNRIREICESGTTVFFVSHSVSLVMNLCKRAIWIEDGRIVQMGDCVVVAKAYEEAVWRRTNAANIKSNAARQKELIRSDDQLVGAQTGAPHSRITSATTTSSENQSLKLCSKATSEIDELGWAKPLYELKNAGLRILSVRMYDSAGIERYTYQIGEDVHIRVEWTGESEHSDIWSGFRIDSSLLQGMAGYAGWETESFLNDGKPLSGKGSFEFQISDLRLGMGTYYVSVGISRKDVLQSKETILYYADRIVKFSVKRSFAHPFSYQYEPKVKIVEPISETCADRRAPSRKLIEDLK